MKKNIIRNLEITVFILSIFSTFLIFTGSIRLHIETLTQTGTSVGFTEIVEKFSAINLIFRTPTKVMQLSHPHINIVILIVYLLPLILGFITLFKFNSLRINIVKRIVVSVILIILPFIMLGEFKSINDYYYRILLDGTQIFNVWVKPDDGAMLFIILCFFNAVILCVSIGREVISNVMIKDKKVKK